MSTDVANILAGLWLFVSAFAWSHTPAECVNAWLCGLLVIGVAAATVRYEKVRPLNYVLAGWIILGSWLLHSEYQATLWNNLIVAAVVLVNSLPMGQQQPKAH